MKYKSLHLKCGRIKTIRYVSVSHDEEIWCFFRFNSDMFNKIFFLDRGLFVFFIDSSQLNINPTKQKQNSSSLPVYKTNAEHRA